MRPVDQLDAALARYFAWSFARPWDTPDIEERLSAAQRDSAAAGPDSELPVVDESSLQRSFDRARAGCRALAQAIAEVWALTDNEASLAATKRLLARADRLGGDLTEMDAGSPDAVRLLRLFVRHGQQMTRRQRERAAAVSMLLPAPEPHTAELADLLVEIAQAGDGAMADALLSEEDRLPPLGDVPMLGVRLADVVDEGPIHAARAVAIDFLARLEPRDTATAALRRALHLPSFAVRARALHALSTSEPPAVTAADLVHVLQDLVAHPPPFTLSDDEHEENERMMAEGVIAALEHVQPPQAEEALLDLIDAEHETVWLDAAWATEALAVAFPETAAAMVDHWLKCAHAHQRVSALAALRRLPLDTAEPRLRLAAADPAFVVRDAAQAQWLERFDRVYPVRAEDLPGAALLEAPASELFLSRLAVVHGRVREARRAMGRALLAEAPNREALILLLQLIGDDTDSGEPSFGSRDEGWASAVVERFGPKGVEGLCALAARFPEPESFGWMRRLGDLVERGSIAADRAGPLRALAAQHVASDDAGRVDDSIRVLARLGAPAELLERVLTLALDDDFGAADARGLVVSWPDRAIDTRLASEMALALAERDWTRLRYAARIALERGAPAARVIAQRVLEVAESEPEAAEAAVECARHLRAVGALDDAWALSVLAHPDQPLFVVAARVWMGRDAVRPALEAALSSRAREGSSAVEAALALLRGEPHLSPRDRRLVSVLDLAAPPERAELVYAMCVCGAPHAVVARHLEELLVSADPNVTSSLVGVALWLKSPKARTLLRAVLPRICDVELRADIEDVLGTGPAPYWAEG